MTKYYVYGVFKKDRCIYVGNTIDPYQRELSHRRRFGKRIRFEVLHETKSWQKAADVEREHISGFRKEGQAEFNLNGYDKYSEPRKAILIPDSLHRKLKILAFSRNKSANDLAAKVLDSYVSSIKNPPWEREDWL